MGFSTIGLLIAAMIFAPNLLFIAFSPKNIPPGIKDAGLLFTIIERIGQAGCMVLLVISKDNFEAASLDVWFFLMMICVAAYYCLWIRYFVRGRDFSLLFKPLGFIPIPMAVFPVLAFSFAAIWGKSVWIGVSAILLAIGHFANSWNNYKYLR